MSVSARSPRAAAPFSVLTPIHSLNLPSNASHAQCMLRTSQILGVEEASLQLYKLTPWNESSDGKDANTPLIACSIRDSDLSMESIEEIVLEKTRLQNMLARTNQSLSMLQNELTRVSKGASADVKHEEDEDEDDISLSSDVDDGTNDSAVLTAAISSVAQEKKTDKDTTLRKRLTKSKSGVSLKGKKGKRRVVRKKSKKQVAKSASKESLGDEADDDDNADTDDEVVRLKAELEASHRVRDQSRDLLTKLSAEFRALTQDLAMRDHLLRGGYRVTFEFSSAVKSDATAMTATSEPVSCRIRFLGANAGEDVSIMAHLQMSEQRASSSGKTAAWSESEAAKGTPAAISLSADTISVDCLVPFVATSLHLSRADNRPFLPLRRNQTLTAISLRHQVNARSFRDSAVRSASDAAPSVGAPRGKWRFPLSSVTVSPETMSVLKLPLGVVLPAASRP